MPRLVDEINRVWDNALHSKDLVVLHTTSSFIVDKGMKVGLTTSETSLTDMCAFAEWRRLEKEGVND